MQIGDQQIRMLALKYLKCLPPIARRARFEPRKFQKFYKKSADNPRIIHDEHFISHFSCTSVKGGPPVVPG